MVLTKIAKSVLFAKIVVNSVGLYWDFWQRTKAVAKNVKEAKKLPSSDIAKEPINIVVVGASFAGYQAAKVLAGSLPPDGRYRVVVVEPNSHFQFTWVLPRFCVIEGQEHKAFIPYGPYCEPSIPGAVRWVQDRVLSVGKESVRLEGSGEEIPYAYLVIATGSGTGISLPSRVGVPGKTEGVELCRAMQQRIKQAKRPIIIGGGAAGVELATDAKSLYPDKHVMLVHSRQGVMHRFGPELQAAALAGLKKLGVEVFLGERVVEEDTAVGTVTLRSGKVVECDAVVHCTGQKPSSQLIAELSPGSITESGHIRVKPTLQIDDDALPNIYIVGDVAHTGVENPNGRAATKQGEVAADNIVAAAWGKKTTTEYKHWWGDAVIKLTLGLDNSITHFGDGKTELLFATKEKDQALMCDGMWSRLGVTPFEDKSFEGESESTTDTTKVEEVVKIEA